MFHYHPINECFLRFFSHASYASCRPRRKPDLDRSVGRDNKEASGIRRDQLRGWFWSVQTMAAKISSHYSLYSVMVACFIFNFYNFSCNLRTASDFVLFVLFRVRCAWLGVVPVAATAGGSPIIQLRELQPLRQIRIFPKSTFLFWFVDPQVFTFRVWYLRVAPGSTVSSPLNSQFSVAQEDPNRSVQDCRPVTSCHIQNLRKYVPKYRNIKWNIIQIDEMSWQSWSKLPTKRSEFRPKTATFLAAHQSHDLKICALAAGSSCCNLWTQACGIRVTEGDRETSSRTWCACLMYHLTLHDSIMHSTLKVYISVNVQYSAFCMSYLWVLPIFSCARGAWGISARAWAQNVSQTAPNCTLRTSPHSTRGLPRLCRCIQTWWDVFCFEISHRLLLSRSFVYHSHAHTQRSESGNSRIAQHRERLLTTGRSADKIRIKYPDVFRWFSCAQVFVAPRVSVSEWYDSIRIRSGSMIIETTNIQQGSNLSKPAKKILKKNVRVRNMGLCWKRR